MKPGGTLWKTHSVAPSGRTNIVWHVKPGYVKRLEQAGSVAFTAVPCKHTPWWELTHRDNPSNVA